MSRITAVAFAFAATLACGQSSSSPEGVVSEDATATDTAVGFDSASSGDTVVDSDTTTDTGTKTDTAPSETSAPDAGVAFGVGAAAVKQRIYGSAPETGTLTTSPVTTHASGSIFLATLGRGTWSAAPDGPTDSKKNVYSLLGTTHAYGAWPNSKTGLYDALSAVGGANHTFSMTWGSLGSNGDEVTISAIEVLGAKSIEDQSWVERSPASSLTSAPVTTKGPAVLVAWWWGSGGVRPVGDKHVAVPGSGFTIVPGATALTSIGTDGYVQVAAAYRVVPTAGTYTVAWTADAEGAQLYLVALR